MAGPFNLDVNATSMLSDQVQQSFGGSGALSFGGRGNNPSAPIIVTAVAFAAGAFIGYLVRGNKGK